MATARAIRFAVRSPIRPADLPGLCDRVCGLLAESVAGVAYCDCSEVDAGAATIDALARLQLAAKRRDCRVYLRNASRELLDLVAFTGLTHVLPG